MKTLALLLTSCLAFTPAFAAETLAQATPPAPVANEDVNTPNAAAHEMLGTYCGAFGLNKITICLQKVVGQTVNGYSVVAGNERAFSGSFTERDGSFILTAKEPGDHPEDGVFMFGFTPGSNRLTGNWKPIKKRNLEAKTFDLPRRAFRYDDSIGDYPETSQRVLKVADVENRHQEELRLMRNEIYARHGYCFRMKDMRRHFDGQDWYMPISIDVTAKLTPTEKKNETLLKRYEKYAAEYYDEFGR